MRRNAPGTYFGPYNSGRRDVVFRVLYAPNDGELQFPLWNPRAEFNEVDVAGMVLDGGLSDGTRLRYADGTEWLVQARELHQTNGTRRMRPVEASKEKHIATMEEVRQ